MRSLGGISGIPWVIHPRVLWESGITGAGASPGGSIPVSHRKSGHNETHEDPSGWLRGFRSHIPNIPNIPNIPQESGDDEYRGEHSDSDDEVDSDFDIDEGDEPGSEQDEAEPRRRRRVLTKAYRVPSHPRGLSRENQPQIHDFGGFFILTVLFRSFRSRSRASGPRRRRGRGEDPRGVGR